MFDLRTTPYVGVLSSVRFVEGPLAQVWSLCACDDPPRVLCGGSWTRPEAARLGGVLGFGLPFGFNINTAILITFIGASFFLLFSCVFGFRVSRVYVLVSCLLFWLSFFGLR